MKLTLRQIEVIRAVQIAGTIIGAARLLNVSAPGISRLVKHTESSTGVRLFNRIGGAFVPNSDARVVFDEINEIYSKIESLNSTMKSIEVGSGGVLRYASVSSIAQSIASRSTREIRERYPDIFLDLDTIKVEESIDYLLLEQGEFVALSHSYQHIAINIEEIVSGKLLVIVPNSHKLSMRKEVSVHELTGEGLIGVSASDPYGAIIASSFYDNNLPYNLSIQARYAQVVLGLVRQGLGVAVIDEFSVAGKVIDGVTRIKLKEDVPMAVYIATKKNRALTSHAEFARECFKNELLKATKTRVWES